MKKAMGWALAAVFAALYLGALFYIAGWMAFVILGVSVGFVALIALAVKLITSE